MTEPVADRGAAGGRAAVAGWAIPATLAWVAGFVDVQCFLGLAQTFAAFMTGTLIALAAELADPTPAAPTKAVMIATFVPAVAAASLALKRSRQRIGDAAAVRRLVLVEAALLAAMMLLGGLLSPLPGLGSWQMTAVAVAGVAAMSLQNVLMVHLLAFHPATTVMTLNTVRLIGHALGALAPARDGPGTHAGEAARYAMAVGPFLLGVVAGSFGYRGVGFWSLAAPVVALVLLGRWLAGPAR